MEQIVNYVKPELLVVAVVLYFVGVALKRAQAIADKYIPLVLGAAGVLICGIYVLSTVPTGTGKEVMMAIFTAVTQGILVAGLSVYVNQVVKQITKDE